MPVLVTGAETAAGRAAVRQLLRAGGQVRAWITPDADEAVVDDLRSGGVKVARGSADDEGRLERALEQTHTVVHAGTSLLTPPDAVLDDVATVLSAAIGAGCRRFVWTSHLLTPDPQGNAWLAACAEAEELLAEAPLQSIVLRCGLLYGPQDEVTNALADDGAPPDAADARHAPLFIRDWAAAVAVADREREGHQDLHVVLALAGPEAVTLGELARMLGRRGPLRQAMRGDSRRWPAHAAEVLRRDADAEEAVGVDGTPLDAGVQQVRQARSARR